MFEVEWRTGVGYGDFVTGLGYAHTASVKYDTPVRIKFFWDHSEDFLYHPDDPETIVERCKYIQTIFKRSPRTIKVEHVFNKRLEYRFLNQLDEFNPLHGLWYSTFQKIKSNRVVVWTSEHNASFPGEAKDPAYKHWDLIKLKLQSEGYIVREVTYRTPISEVMDEIKHCGFGVGYDGLAHQLFKFMWKPLIVFCQRKKLNNLLIPQAVLEDDPIKFLSNPTDFFVDESNERVRKYKQLHKEYMNDKKDYTQSRFYNTPIG